jgi:hypothetical protein
MSQYGSDPNAPTGSDFNTSGDPPTWPKVVGIISIVLASLGVVCGLCGMVFVVALGPFMQKMGELQAQGGGARGGPVIPTTTIPTELVPGPMSVVAAIIGPIGSIVLLVAGITTVRRAASGRSIHLAYVAASLLATALALVGAYQYQASASSFMAAHPDDGWSKFFMSRGGSGGQFVQAIAVSCVGAIYPIFCLVWFGIMGKRPEVGSMPQEPLV